MLHIKKLNLDEIREVYNVYMHEAFPPSELRPFASMEMLYNKNCYPCYGFYDETDSLCAYAYFSCTENGKYALLDYFAVKKDLRGTGIGSKTFPLLRTEMKDRDGLLLEVESVESAETEEEVNIRRRRIAFYERCGCEMTKAKSLLYGVDFNILVLPIAQPVPEAKAVLHELESIYHVMFDDELYKRVCHPFIAG